MEGMILLSLVAALAVTPVTPVTVECINGNCTESNLAPAFNLKIGSIFPFWGPVDFDEERDREPLDDAINPLEPATNESDASGGYVSVHMVRVYSIPDLSQPDSDEPKGDLNQPMGDNLMGPLLQKMFDNIFADMGLLDLSWRTLTSAEVYSALADRKAQGRPVTTLILSNSRIYPMDGGTFAAAEGTINTLVMANASVNLDALRGLTNLKVLNLSNNALSTFPWYGLMADTLEVLDLSQNRYEEIRPELSMLRNLRELYLSNNKIMYVEEAPLVLMPNLETLDLSMNVIQRANLAGLANLNKLNLDWNFLSWIGKDCSLPSQPLLLKLASNPWRCDCGLLQARDNNEILDLDLLQCVMHSNVDSYCVGCERSFLPDRDGQKVAALTEDLIGHRGCNDIPELYNYLSDEYVKLRDTDSCEFALDIVLFIMIFIFVIVCVFVFIKICCCPKNVNKGKVWVMPQEIQKWSFDKLGKQEEVPYIKIDKTPI